MSPNHKLTNVLKGRTISGTSNAANVLTIVFADGSKMTVHTAGASNSPSTGSTVKGVRQVGTELNLDFEDGSTFTTTTAESTSSVMVRDKDGGAGVCGLSVENFPPGGFRTDRTLFCHCGFRW